MILLRPTPSVMVPSMPEAGLGDRIRAAHPAGMTHAAVGGPRWIAIAAQSPLEWRPALRFADTGCLGCTLEIAGALDLRGRAQFVGVSW